MKLFTFKPNYGQTQSIIATGAVTGLAADAEDLLLTREGTGTMFVRVTEGTDVTAATAADLPVPPGVIMTIGKSGNAKRNETRLAVFAPSTGGTLYITPGNGA